MRKLLYLTTLAMLAMLMLAPAAMGQTNLPSQPIDPGSIPAGIQGPCPEGSVTQTGSDACVPEEDFLTCEEVYGPDYCVAPETSQSVIQPGTREACEGIANQAEFEECVAPFDTPPETQPTEPVAPVPAPVEPMTTATTSVALPDTGGPALLMPLLGVLLVAGGLVMRRR